VGEIPRVHAGGVSRQWERTAAHVLDAEGATRPESLRQKDRGSIVDSGERSGRL